MASDRRVVGVTFDDAEHPDVLECVSALDALVERFRTLAEEGKCGVQSTRAREIDPMEVISYRTVYLYFKARHRNSVSQFAANVMQVLFDMQGPDGERLVRFYCVDYNELPGACTCQRLLLPPKPDAPIRYWPLSEIRVARDWRVNRADLLALTDEQLDAIQVHPNTRRHVINFITWLRANPRAL